MALQLIQPNVQTLILFKKLRVFSAFGNVSGFSYSTYFHYVLDVSQILRDNHETTAIREATPKNDIQGHRNGKRTKYNEIFYNYCKFSIGTQASSLITRLLCLMPLLTPLFSSFLPFTRENIPLSLWNHFLPWAIILLQLVNEPFFSSKPPPTLGCSIENLWLLILCINYCINSFFVTF